MELGACLCGHRRRQAAAPWLHYLCIERWISTAWMTYLPASVGGKSRTEPLTAGSPSRRAAAAARSALMSVEVALAAAGRVTGVATVTFDVFGLCSLFSAWAMFCTTRHDSARVIGARVFSGCCDFIGLMYPGWLHTAFRCGDVVGDIRIRNDSSHKL